jgi:hypothetical protein
MITQVGSSRGKIYFMILWILKSNLLDAKIHDLSITTNLEIIVENPKTPLIQLSKLDLGKERLKRKRNSEYSWTLMINYYNNIDPSVGIRNLAGSTQIIVKIFTGIDFFFYKMT